jgi:hypothetical protein
MKMCDCFQEAVRVFVIVVVEKTSGAKVKAVAALRSATALQTLAEFWEMLLRSEVF